MQCKITNKMVKVLKEALPKDYEVKLLKLTPDEYKNLVHYDGLYYADICGDYDLRNNVCKVIKVIYPPDFYAMPAYITTHELKEYYNDAKKDGVVTIDNYKKALFAGIEV